MTNAIETIEITSEHRYAYYQDESFDYLKEYDWDCWGLFTISRGMNAADLALDTFGLNKRLESIMENKEFSWNDSEAVTAISKAITRGGYQHAFINLGYSPWHYLVIYWNPELLIDHDRLISEFREWYEGNVFTVALEKLEKYESLSGKTIEQWETLESVGQVIFTDKFQFSNESCQELLGLPTAVAA